MAEAKWFAGRLRELREQAGLTQQELAEKAGFTRGGIAQLESGRRKPAWETVVALAQALGVDCTAFMQQPAAVVAAGPGRPRKPAAEGEAAPEPKRPRGRPKKPPQAAQEGRTSAQPADEPSTGKKPARGRGRKTKGT